MSAVMEFAQRSAAYLRAVQAEVYKVTWPTWTDLRRTTLVIIVFVIVLAVIIGMMELVASKLLIDRLGGLFR